ncbi:hypothetical protein BN77_3189 [Rhizobium mesoamericanum STM3625]|uniref:Uncharacterized protein n=1 Tax=Rhizobium mesoamericanum STM3625 TaxID=1211777 RepID=K0PXC1_9HYPH|nr:hypothetical protein BN77_3189 [Rhizobium mesoamericanum STM3625]
MRSLQKSYLFEIGRSSPITPCPAIAVGRYEGVSQDIDTSAIETFEPNETLDELVASFRRDHDAKEGACCLGSAPYLLREAFRIFGQKARRRRVRGR